MTSEIPRQQHITHIIIWPVRPCERFLCKTIDESPVWGRTHLRERDWKKPYGPTTKAYSLVCLNFNKIFLQIGDILNYFLTKLGRPDGKIFALGLYGMTSSQIFSHPALPLSQ